MRIQIYQASSTLQYVAVTRTLFAEYAADIGVDLCFQGFAAELAELPGCYAPPRGRLLVALADGEAAGCIALRPLACRACEMKRLYVRPAFRGQGLGRRLTQRIVDEARSIGEYSTIKLDTLPQLSAALRLYKSLGFAHCAAYNQTPLSETVYMELKLR